MVQVVRLKRKKEPTTITASEEAKGQEAIVCFRSRLVLRDLSRSHDVQQGIAVAKKYEDMSRLLGSDVLNEIGPLNHPSP